MAPSARRIVWVLVVTLCSTLLASCRDAPTDRASSPSTSSTLSAPSAEPIASTVDIAAASDEFNDPTTQTNWTVMQGDLPDGRPGDFDIGQTSPGNLTVAPSRSWWVNNTRAFFLYKQIRGDFTVTVRVRASGRHGGLPSVDWSLAGLLIRAPHAEGVSEYWVGYTAGFVGGPMVERKTTRAGHSDLRLEPVEPGWIDLRVARCGSLIILLRRQGEAWTLDAAYNRPDLPQEVQVGIDAQSGYDSDHADLAAEADWIRFTPTGIPDQEREAVVSRLSNGVDRNNGNTVPTQELDLVRDALLPYLTAQNEQPADQEGH